MTAIVFMSEILCKLQMNVRNIKQGVLL